MCLSHKPSWFIINVVSVCFFGTERLQAEQKLPFTALWIDTEINSQPMSWSQANSNPLMRFLL